MNADYGNFHNLSVALPIITGPNSSIAVYHRASGWVWTCGPDRTWVSGCITVQRVGGGWVALIDRKIVSVGIGLYCDALDLAVKLFRHYRYLYPDVEIPVADYTGRWS